jgi:hypothetical protein
MEPLVRDELGTADEVVVRAADRLHRCSSGQGTRCECSIWCSWANPINVRLVYRAGTTKGITFPTSVTFTTGLGAAFSIGAIHKLERAAAVQDVTVMHVRITHSSILEGRDVWAFACESWR